MTLTEKIRTLTAQEISKGKAIVSALESLGAVLATSNAKVISLSEPLYKLVWQSDRCFLVPSSMRVPTIAADLNAVVNILSLFRSESVNCII